VPGGLTSPNNPFLGSAPSTQPNSRGIEGMAITPNRKYLYAALGATVADTDRLRRYIFEYSTTRDAFTGRVAQYHTELPANLVADMWALDRHRLVVIERDLGCGVSAVFRRIYMVDLRRTDAAGFLVKTQLVDLTAVPNPHLVSLPETHPGDLGLGDPFWVMCESVEAVHLVCGNRLLVGLTATGRRSSPGATTGCPGHLLDLGEVVRALERVPGPDHHGQAGLARRHDRFRAFDRRTLHA
jgi:glycerophosphoryl diester phosphodiesterase